MRFYSAVQKQRNVAFKVIALQAAGVCFVAFLWLFLRDAIASLAAFAGGAATVIPMLLLTWYLFATTSSCAPKRMALTLALGEFLKLMITGFSIGLLMIRMPQEMVPVLTGFASAFLGLWISPLLVGTHQKNKRVMGL